MREVPPAGPPPTGAAHLLLLKLSRALRFLPWALLSGWWASLGQQALVSPSVQRGGGGDGGGAGGRCSPEFLTLQAGKQRSAWSLLQPGLSLKPSHVRIWGAPRDHHCRKAQPLSCESLCGACGEVAASGEGEKTLHHRALLVRQALPPDGRRPSRNLKDYRVNEKCEARRLWWLLHYSNSCLRS